MKHETYDLMVRVRGIESCSPSEDGIFLTTVLIGSIGERFLVEIEHEAAADVLHLLKVAANRAADLRKCENDPRVGLSSRV